MSAGITSQYGFLYQRYVFISTIINHIGVDKFFTYEGIDDIDVSEKDAIYSINSSNNICIQVKSGNVSKDCWAKVIGNWLLINDNISSYKLVLEKELQFDIKSEDVVDRVCDYFVNGVSKTPSSIANKVYKKFMKNQHISKQNLKKKIIELTDQVYCYVQSLEQLKKSIEENFKSTYCQDIKVYEMAKTCRCERFIEYINVAIDESISKKKSYILRYVDFIKIIGRVSSEIGDRKYSIDIGEMKKKKRSEAEKIMDSNVLREVRQLRQVNSKNGFIISELIKEMLYRDFRDVFVIPDSTLISNIEETAFSNYEDVIYSLPPGSSPKQIFDETVEKDIPLSIVDNSPLYRHGCYIFLTSDEADEEKKIT